MISLKNGITKRVASVSWPNQYNQMIATNATTDIQKYFQRAIKPSVFFRVILRKSSTKPIAP